MTPSNKYRNRYLLLLALLFVGWELNLYASSQLQTLYSTYLNSVHQLKSGTTSSSQVQAFNQEWLKRFEQALAQTDSQDPGKKQILFEVIALNASVGNVPQAYKFNRELLNLTTDPAEKEIMKINLAELSYSMFQGDGENEVKQSQVQEDFKNANASLSDEPRVPETLDFLTKMGDFQHRIGDNKAATDTYLYGAGLLAKLPLDSQGTHSVAGFSQENFLQQAIETAYASDNGDEAQSLFLTLIGLEHLQKSPSYYFYLFSKFQDATYGSTFRKSCRHWLDQHPNDPWNGMLQFYLARSFYGDKMYAPAAKLYSQLLQTSLVDLSGTTASKEGITKEVLVNLASSLNELGEREEASKIYNLVDTLKKKAAK